MSETLIDRMRLTAGELWEQAITHASYGREHNQRLEFIGNSVLNMVIADQVYRRFPEREGRLSVMCNFQRSDRILNEVGRSICLDKWLKLGPSLNGRPVDSIVAGAVEEVIGAVFQRSGYETASGFVKELLLTDALVERAGEHQDPISELKELVEARNWKMISRGFDEVVGEKRVSYHAIELNGKAVVGMGSSPRMARVEAARIVLSTIDSHP